MGKEMQEPSQSTSDPQSFQFAEHMKQVGTLLDQFGKVLGRARELDTRNQLLEGLQEKLAKTRRKWEEQRFQIAVLALVKSGKSTLINSWLGDEYLPAANTPETTHIVRIQHSQERHGELREGTRVLASGAAETNGYLRELNKQGREANELPREDELVLEAPLVALEGRPLGTQRFEVLDTPGPNEAGTSALRAKVERVLDNADVIVYVLDYTKLKTAEEQALFELLKEMRPELLRRCSERLFFVVNKIDLKNRNGLTLSETATYVTELLAQQLPDVTLSPERIIPVAAERALLARIVGQGNPSEKALADFINIVFGISGEDKTLEDCRPHAQDLLQRSRVPRLEEEVLSFIYRNRGRLMLQGLLDDLSRFLKLLENQLLTSEAALKKDHEELVQKKQALEEDLGKIKEGLQDVATLTQRFELDTEKWVRKQFERFGRTAQAIISAAFNQHESRGSFPARILRGLEQLWGLMRGQPSDAETARQQILQVNARLVRLLENEFADFQQALESEAYDKQRELFDQLQERIAPLARRIEREVGKALNISLVSAPVRLPRPSLDEFQHELRSRIDTLVERTHRYREQVSQEQYLKKRGGLCSKDEYGFRDVVTQVPYTTHEVARQQLQRVWSEQLDALATTSVRTARAVVGDMLASSLKQARSELETYAASFLQTLERELRTSVEGKTQREARLRTVEERLHEVGQLSSLMNECARELGVHSGTHHGPGARDVFISYDRRDVVPVRRIIHKLEARGISVWVDFRDLRPGLPWQPELEKQIQASGAVAVFIGRNGLSYWQDNELQAFFREAKNRGCPIIPVVLQDCEQEPKLPVFLEGMHRVDFRHTEPDPIEQLVYGIQGNRPSAG
jgi:small GTP-binding protein